MTPRRASAVARPQTSTEDGVRRRLDLGEKEEQQVTPRKSALKKVTPPGTPAVIKRARLKVDEADHPLARPKSQPGSSSFGPVLPIIGGSSPQSAAAPAAGDSREPEAPIASSAAAAPEAKAAGAEGQLEDTLPYDDEATVDQDETLPYSDSDALYFWTGQSSQSQASSSSPADPQLDESLYAAARAEADQDALEHAISQAAFLAQYRRREDQGLLPWTRAESDLVVQGHFTKDRCFFYSWSEDRCFSVSSDDTLTEADIARHWDKVEKADREEATSFIQHKVFKLEARSAASNVVDGTWVRRWKGNEVRSRCCGRGFLDRQRQDIDRHSSTASRLSHRLAVSLACIHGLELEAIDISAAFLQGLRFSELAARAKELGHSCRSTRNVWFRPPANLWRHFREIEGSNIRVSDQDSKHCILRCLKALYGLVDGPLLWQLALLHFLRFTLGFTVSRYDDGLLYIISPQGALVAITTVHVDDLFLAARRAFRDYLVGLLEQRFGKVKRQQLPFVHLGVWHVCLGPCRLFLHQGPYLAKLLPGCLSTNERRKKTTDPLDPAEHKEFRSVVCSLLWVCQTRLDICHDVCALQSEMVSPQVIHMLEANSLLKRAQRDSCMNGLHYGPLSLPLRLVAVADCGHASKKSCYPYEGMAVLLMHDSFGRRRPGEWSSGAAASSLGGSGHVVYFSARRAKRISHSTSHAETLAAVGCTQIAQLVSARITEIFAGPRFFAGRTPTIQDLLSLQQASAQEVPVDHVTDCMDLLELVTGARGISNDKNQRLAIMALREDRMETRTRYSIHVPTRWMLADGLTKTGSFPQLLRFCTTGLWQVSGEADIRARRLEGTDQYTEDDLRNLSA